MDTRTERRLLADIEELRRKTHALEANRPQLLYTSGKGGGGGGGTLPTGEHDGQVYQMVSDSQAGWDFPRFHPIPD